MAEDIHFDFGYLYNTQETGIVVPTELWLGTASVRIRAKVDTGSAFCIFERLHGENLGLDIETGIPLRMITATGGFLAFGHMVDLSVLGIITGTTVYFAEEESFYLNILGRQGWLDRVKLGLIDYEGKLLLSGYGD
jgi:hypothetical protein